MMIALLVVASMTLSACGGAQATAPAATSAPVEPTTAPVAVAARLRACHAPAMGSDVLV